MNPFRVVKVPQHCYSTGVHYMTHLGEIGFVLHSVKMQSAEGGHESLQYSNFKSTMINNNESFHQQCHIAAKTVFLKHKLENQIMSLP